MITNVPGLVLATFYADCVPLFFVDPVHKAIGLSHSGWRGTVGKIGKVTVEKMAEEFQTDPSELYAAIGPSICQDCYEVSEDVIKKFRENYDENLWPEIFYQKEDGKYQYLDKQTFEYIDLDDEIVDKAKKAFIERLEKRRLKEPKKEIKEVTPIKNNVVSLSKYKNKTGKSKRRLLPWRSRNTTIPTATSACWTARPLLSSASAARVMLML